MESRLEVVPEKLLLVLGPSFAASLVKERAPNDDTPECSSPPPFTYNQLASRLISAAKTTYMEDVPVEAETSSKYGVALQQAVKIMGKNGAFAHWLQRTFTTKLQLQSNDLLEKVLALQRDGALIAYSSMDDIVARSAKQTPLVLTKDGDSWARGVSKGIMHLFGVYDAPDSVHVPMQQAPKCSEQVRAMLGERTCILVGFHAVHDVPLVRSIVQLLQSNNAPKPLWVVEQDVDCSDSPASPLPISTGSLPESLCSIGEISKAVGKMIQFPPVAEEEDQCLSLLLANKSDIMQVSGLVSSAPGVNFVFVNALHYQGLYLHSISLRVPGKEMASFWRWFTSQEITQQLLNSAVLATVFKTGLILWLNGGRSFSTGIRCSSQRATNSPFKPPSPSQQPPSPPVKKQTTVPRYILEVKRSSSSQPTGPVNPYHQKLLNQLGAHDDVGANDHSTLKRRLSLPYTGTMPQAPFTKVKPTQNFSASPRHQLLLSKYIFGRTNKPKLTESKMLKDLLKTEVKSEMKSTSLSDQVDLDPAQYISQTRAKRRRALYLEDNLEWSSQTTKHLKCKVKKWEKQHLQEKMVKKEVLSRKSSGTSTSSEKDCELKQQLANPLPGPTSATIGNMFLPQTTNVPSMVYPYISTYPFITSVPVNSALPLPYVPILPQSQVLPTLPTNFLLMPNSSTTTTASTKLTNGDGYQTPILTSHLKSSYPTVMSVQGRKRPLEKSCISSLLQSNGPLHAKRMKNAQNVSPAVNGDETSRRERAPSAMAVATGDSGGLNLWQFLLELLLSTAHNNLIRWTGVGLEFQISRPEEIAHLWRSYQQNESLDFTHFVKALKYYCNSQPIVLVASEGKSMVYCFSASIFWYIHMRCGQLNKSFGNPSLTHLPVDSSKEVLVVD